MAKYFGKHETGVQVEADWATLDVVVHWELHDDHTYEIEKITVGSQELREGFNEDYFAAIIEDMILGADYAWGDHGETYA